MTGTGVMNKKLLIIGAGGHGRVVADVASRTGRYEALAFLDDSVPEGPLPYPYLGNCAMAEQLVAEYDMFVAIGNGAVRQKLMERLVSIGAHMATVIAPDAVIGADVQIGTGTVIMSGVVINTATRIGQGVIVNTASSVDHDCVIEDYCHVAVGAHLCGTIHIGAQTWIGAGATVINNTQICSGCIIGAGAVVIRNIEEAGTYVGVPAKKV